MLRLLILPRGYQPTRATTAIGRPVRTTDGVRFIERVSPLAMRLGGVALELGIRGAMKVLAVRLSYEVVRVAARWVRTGVAGFQPTGNRSPTEVHGQTVSEPRSPLSTRADAKVPVARREPVALPGPTNGGTSGLINLRPKPLIQRPDDLFRSIVHKRIAMPLKTAVMHLAPSPLFGGLNATGYGAIHVSNHTPYRGPA